MSLKALCLHLGGIIATYGVLGPGSTLLDPLAKKIQPNINGNKSKYMLNANKNYFHYGWVDMEETSEDYHMIATFKKYHAFLACQQPAVLAALNKHS